MATPNTYDKGDLVRCSAAWTDTAGAAVDPTVVIFKFKNPAGTVTTYTYGTNPELVKDSVGNYHVDVDGSSSGVWYYSFVSTGTGQASDENQFVVSVSEF